MKRCKICHVEAELTDGRCNSCRMAYEATDVYHTTYGKYAAMISRDKQEQPAQPRHTPDVITRNCVWCGKPFPKIGARIYCSDMCYRARNRAAKLERMGMDGLEPKICPACEETFTPRRRNQIYCSLRCSGSHRAQYLRWEARQNDRHGTD